MRILLVDDDELLTQTLTNYLTSQHYAVDVAIDGEAGWDYTQVADYDLIVLDINLPKLDGVRLCQKLRQNKCNSPILLLTGKGDSSDKIMGLDAGADDYLVKPCNPEELSARIRALLRRQNPSANPFLEWGGLCLDPGACEVTYQGQLLLLSPKEYSLLELFLRNPQRIFNSSIILEHLWGFENAPGEETIRTHIKRLRRKLKSVGADDLIDTVYGMGYRLKAPTEPTTSKPVDSSAADQARAAAINLWNQFKPSILQRMTSLDHAVAELKTGSLSDQVRQTALADAHKLAGSLGMFGFPTGSQLGREIEGWLQTTTTNKGSDQLQSLVVALHQEIQRSPCSSDESLLTILSNETTEVKSTFDPGLASLNREPSQHGQSPQITVLVVDDDLLILDALQQFLPRWGICPITLNNPLELWDALGSNMPDLLILDVDMPHISGIELCRVIRNDDVWNGLPILFLTAHRDTETILQLYSAGADDYVAKPFSEAEIVTRIFNRLERNRLLKTWQKPIL